MFARVWGKKFVFAQKFFTDFKKGYVFLTKRKVTNSRHNTI
jgi:hypothetical protein